MDYTHYTQDGRAQFLHPFSFCNKANIQFINVGFFVTHQMESFPETPLVELSLGCWTGTGTGLHWTGIQSIVSSEAKIFIFTACLLVLFVYLAMKFLL